MPEFNHLHCHTQFSLLDGAANIPGMYQKAAADGMKAIALTDHGNMFGAFKFVQEAKKHNIKPIVGCEFYLVEDRHQKQFTKEKRDNRYHQLMLAKNEIGYRNLSRLCSLGYMEGLYSKWPRIDKELVLRHHEGLIATTCCLGAEVPQAILTKGEEAAEELFKWWLDIFEDDYYVELQRHNLEEQQIVNAVLLKFAQKHNVKTIATNDSHYLNEDDAEAHDILLCVNTAEFKSKPIWKGPGFGSRDYRFGFPNNSFYFKSQSEMNELFKDVPQAIDFTNEIVDKVNTPDLQRDILLPNFPLPEGFKSAQDYLRHLTLEGARSPKRYGQISQEIQERIDLELNIIGKMGFAGYFLITADLINAGKNMGVLIGPGRGSAAGSVVAYCSGITNIDPIKYDLLFERFLNPERISMPDIDTDFDDEGREKVIEYVVDKYGQNQVAHIITYGTMAAKMAIRDVGRVLELPLSETNTLAKLIPDGVGITLEKAFEDVKELKALRKGNDIRAEVLKMAEQLEGSLRNSGIHAAGVIIAPDDITNYIPVSTSKDSELLITQFDGKVVEDAGMLKMDFLGLKTLSIIKSAARMIELNTGRRIDIDEIPLDDPKTFELYQKADTVGTFQFESSGMRKYLQDLKPTNIEDLIAMNALFRPGPMEFIPNYINRKHGKEKVEYPHPLLEPILKNTFGIMVYQEQIMQAAQILAGYSLGQADLLRRAMGKKIYKEMNRQQEIFVKGALEKNEIEKKSAEEIFGIMEKFASYGFNRSHSAAYSVLAFQTAYLKAHYPAEYMAAVLTHNHSNIDKITFFMDECRHLGIEVLGPHINESGMFFAVNKEGQIRFGLNAIKGSGEAAVQAIISEREENGEFENLYDLAKRVNLRSVNKRTFECLAMGGAFDCFSGIHRNQFFFQVNGEPTFIEKLIKYGNKVQSEENASQASLFGDQSDILLPPPQPPDCEEYPDLEKLKLEKEVVGFYISGHPLDQYQIELKNFCTCTVNEVEDYKNQDISVAGIIIQSSERIQKNGKAYGLFTLEDYEGSLDMAFFGEEYLKYRHLLQVGCFVYIQGKVEERWGREGVWQLMPRSVQLLSDIRQKLTKELVVHIDIEKVDEDLAEYLVKLGGAHSGNCVLKVNIWDEEEKIEVDLLSRKFKINPENELIEEIEKDSRIKYEIVAGT